MRAPTPISTIKEQGRRMLRYQCPGLPCDLSKDAPQLQKWFDDLLERLDYWENTVAPNRLALARRMLRRAEAAEERVKELEQPETRVRRIERALATDSDDLAWLMLNDSLVAGLVEVGRQLERRTPR